MEIAPVSSPEGTVTMPAALDASSLGRRPVTSVEKHSRKRLPRLALDRRGAAALEFALTGLAFFGLVTIRHVSRGAAVCAGGPGLCLRPRRSIVGRGQFAEPFGRCYHVSKHHVLPAAVGAAGLREHDDIAGARCRLQRHLRRNWHRALNVRSGTERQPHAAPGHLRISPVAMAIAYRRRSFRRVWRLDLRNLPLPERVRRQ